jgi:hypothetical protein
MLHLLRLTMRRYQRAVRNRAELVAESFDHEIAMAKLAGKDTTKMELDKSKMLSREANKKASS